MTKDWIFLTISPGGYRKRLRASSILSFGEIPGGGTYIDFSGKQISVCESADEVEELINSAEEFVVLPVLKGEDCKF